MDLPAIDDPRIMVNVDLPNFGLALRLPRFDFMPEPTLDELDQQLTAINKNTKLNQRQKLRNARLAMFKRVLSDEDYQVLDGFTVGQLEMIYDEWATKSGIALGEYLASATSSTENTEAPLPMTSSSADTTEQTSDAA